MPLSNILNYKIFINTVQRIYLFNNNHNPIFKKSTIMTMEPPSPTLLPEQHAYSKYLKFRLKHTCISMYIFMGGRNNASNKIMFIYSFNQQNNLSFFLAMGNNTFCIYCICTCNITCMLDKYTTDNLLRFQMQRSFFLSWSVNMINAEMFQYRLNI